MLRTIHSVKMGGEMDAGVIGSQRFGLDAYAQAIIDQRLPIIYRFVSQFTPVPVDSRDTKSLRPIIDQLLSEASESQWHELGLHLGLLENDLELLTQQRWKVGTFSTPICG